MADTSGPDRSLLRMRELPRGDEDGENVPKAGFHLDNVSRVKKKEKKKQQTATTKRLIIIWFYVKSV